MAPSLPFPNTTNPAQAAPTRPRARGAALRPGRDGSEPVPIGCTTAMDGVAEVRTGAPKSPSPASAKLCAVVQIVANTFKGLLVLR